MGNLVLLACSIEVNGLLQPVGITKGNELVFGERRLRACRDILGWREIDVRIVDVQSITQGENDENEIRKDFTPSERVAIAEAIKAEIGERRGRPPEEKVDSGPQYSGEKTRDVVAEKAGFGSGKEYDRARKVVENAEPEVVEAMDNGELSISRASKVAELEPAEQREVVNTPKPKQNERLKEIERRGLKINHDVEERFMDTRSVSWKVGDTTEHCRNIIRNRVPVDEFMRTAHLKNIREYGPQVIEIIQEILDHDKERKSTAA